MADAPAATPAPEGPASGGKTTAEVRDLADKMRGRVDAFGKAIGALATTGVTAVGLAKIGDLFPTEDERGWFVAAIAGFVVGALAVIYIAARLSKVSLPVYMRTDLDGMETDGEIDSAEHKTIEPLFERTAYLNGARSLSAYEERERELRRVARWCTDEEERKARTQQADEIGADIDHTLARGLLVIVRRRSAKAVTGRGAWVAYGLFVSGLVLFALGTDKISSVRSDPATAKSCADARTAGATADDLAHTQCEPKAGEPKAPPPEKTNAEVRTGLAKSALDALETCEASVKTLVLSREECEPLRTAATQLLPR